MRAFDLNLVDSEQPVYLRIAESFRRAFRAGEIEMGSLLPSTRDLAGQLDIHRHTVTRGLEELVAEGWLVSEPGRGYRVAVQVAESDIPSPGDWPQFPILEQLGQDYGEAYAFPSGKPDLRRFPGDEFFRELRRTLKEVPAENLLGYSDPLGCTAFRQELKSYLARMRGLCDGEVMVTHGSQEAIFLIGQLLADKERPLVAVEALGYSPAWDALRLSGSKLVGIPVDRYGIRVDVLERQARESPPALVYVTPLHQYPTTVTLSLERRRQLLEVCARYRIPVLEDDYDHEFHYRGKPVLPLAADDESGQVLYVSTFSKLVYPSCRLGFCLVPKALVAPLARLKRSVSRQNDLLLQLTMARWMRAGGLDRHLRKMRKLYHERLQVMVDSLRTIGLYPEVPNGGMSVWVDLGPNSSRVLARCRELGLNLRPSQSYCLEPERQGERFVRLGFAGSEPAEIRCGIAILGQSLRETAT